MKKFVLSIFVIVSFGLYVVFQNTGNSSKNLLVPTTPVSSNNQNTKKVSKPVVVVPTTSKKTGLYKDGEYTGDSVDAYYGNVQVKAIISGGKLTDVLFLDYPQDRGTSIRINSRALPILKQEAISAQNANINVVSGASETSPAFIQSLASALSKAKA